MQELKWPTLSKDSVAASAQFVALCTFFILPSVFLHISIRQFLLVVFTPALGRSVLSLPRAERPLATASTRSHLQWRKSFSSLVVKGRSAVGYGGPPRFVRLNTSDCLIPQVSQLLQIHDHTIGCLWEIFSLNELNNRLIKFG